MDDPILASECRQRRAEALRRVYLFADLSEDLFEEALSGLRERELAADHWLCFHRDPADSFYLVLEGEVALLRHSAEGEELIVTIVGPGELFGEDLVFLEEAQHPLSARTLGPCRVGSLDRRRFRSFLQRDPGLLYKLLHTLQRRNAILLDEIERVTIQSASERLMTFLESQRAINGGAALPLRISKRVLASRLSIRPETLSRILGQLKACHRLLEVDGCLLPGTAGDTAETCAACPARVWGCPGPERPGLPVEISGSRSQHG